MTNYLMIHVSSTKDDICNMNQKRIQNIYEVDAQKYVKNMNKVRQFWGLIF